MVLTDKDYKVLACMRTHKDEGRGWAVAPGLLYPTHLIRLHTPLSEESLNEACGNAEQKFTLKSAPLLLRLTSCFWAAFFYRL